MAKTEFLKFAKALRTIIFCQDRTWDSLSQYESLMHVKYDHSPKHSQMRSLSKIMARLINMKTMTIKCLPTIRGNQVNGSANKLYQKFLFLPRDASSDRKMWIVLLVLVWKLVSPGKIHCVHDL